MSAHIDRARMLYHQARFELAEQELRKALLEQPQDSHAHSILGLCLMRQDKLPEAQREVDQAIVSAPDDPFPHYCRALVLDHRNRYEEAEQSAREALRLDPADADYYAKLAVTLFNQKKWGVALEVAERGLHFDGEHPGCSNLRSMALTRLGRQEDAIATVDEALARDPDDEMAHTNKGWALLHAGQPKEALVHFREALRLDPNFEYARQGTIEALKARNPIYRWMLVYFLWMARLDSRVQWGIILGGYFGFRFLRRIARTNPDLEPWINPILIIYLVFALLSWFAYPLFNLLLRLNKFGKHALSRDQRTASNWLGICILVSMIGIAVSQLTSFNEGFFVSLVALGLAMPLVTIYVCDEGWPRQMMALYTSVMALVGVISIILIVLGNDLGFTVLGLFGLGFFASQFLANYLASVTVKN